MATILGISAFYHDSAAALVRDGEIIAAVQEERFTRIKHTASFPSESIRFCLAEAGTTIDDLDAVVFYDKPFLKFERLLETYYAVAPLGLSSFLKAIPVWLREKLFLKKNIRDELRRIEDHNKKNLNLLFSEHHLSHAASAFYPSPFETAAILTIDGVGEWCTASISKGTGNTITLLREMHFPHSVGLLYSSFTYFLGFRVNSGEYKLMGLAPYGNQADPQTQDFIDCIKTNLVDIKDDGSIVMNMSYFKYPTGLTMVDDEKWSSLFNIARRVPESPTTQAHANLALAIQHVTEEIVLKMAAEAKRLTGENNLCLAGGVALNCVANGKIVDEKMFDHIWIQPAAGDAGGALGAALAVHHLHFKKERARTRKTDAMKGAYLGPYFTSKDILRMNRRHSAICTPVNSEADLVAQVARLLAEGMVVGWFQGRMEFGPRALGNRSILADPRSPDMQSKLNLKIKYRESFRPFAPSVLAEDCRSYFTISEHSPYMLLTAPIEHSKRVKLPDDYAEKPLHEKLACTRSEVPAITHVDYSARIQAVTKESNPRFYALIAAFKAETNCPMLINTSFNVRGEPIVCTPTDAFQCFMNTEMDVLVIEDYLYFKTDQGKALWDRSAHKVD